ncbi:unnamed protein product [Wickerhamomyces anomalus]
MTQSFDPLSFFSAQEFKNDNDGEAHMTNSLGNGLGIQLQSVNFIIAENNNNIGDVAVGSDPGSTVDGQPDSNDKKDIENSSFEQSDAIHVLDLPPLSNSLPIPVLTTILKFLQPEEELNFGSVEPTSRNQTETRDETLNSKGVSINEYQYAQEWLVNNGFIKLANNLCYIQFSQSFFQYLNKILASRFASDDTILKLTSLRISENCGRTAKPNFQRKIILKNFETPIVLFEPALTSDNLGLKTWGSSLILSELIVENHQSLILEPVLELGAGTGLCGLTVDLLGYKDVIMTDLPEILPNLMKNKDLNHCDAQCEVLDWTDPKSFIDTKGELTFNTIVIADPIYSSDHPNYVVNMMHKFLSKTHDARILLQIPIRKTFENERAKLWSLLEENNFQIVDEKIIDGYDDFGAQKFIYKEIRWRI